MKSSLRWSTLIKRHPLVKEGFLWKLRDKPIFLNVNDKIRDPDIEPVNCEDPKNIQIQNRIGGRAKKKS